MTPLGQQEITIESMGDQDRVLREEAGKFGIQGVEAHNRTEENAESFRISAPFSPGLIYCVSFLTGPSPSARIGVVKVFA
jgi:hypothetical protein